MIDSDKPNEAFETVFRQGFLAGNCKLTKSDPKKIVDSYIEDIERLCRTILLYSESIDSETVFKVAKLLNILKKKDNHIKIGDKVKILSSGDTGIVTSKEKMFPNRYGVTIIKGNQTSLSIVSQDDFVLVD